MSTAYNYLLKNVIVSADRLSDRFDITPVVAQLDVYEHMDKPFLTADLIFVDFGPADDEIKGLLDAIDFQGTERVEIVYGLADDGAKSIKRTFFVELIEHGEKSTDQSEAIMLRLIEDRGYKNYLQNVNQAYYNMRGDEIIKSIYGNYIGGNVDFKAILPDVEPFTCVIPNWHPFEATTWITKRLSRSFGVPYFMYSVLGQEDIIVNDLASVLIAPAVNLNSPYQYSSPAAAAAGLSGNPNDQAYIIDNYTTEFVEDNLALIRKGYVGGMFSSVDVSTDVSAREIYDYSADQLFSNLRQDGIISTSDGWLPLDMALNVDGKYQTQYQSRNVTEITAENTYGALTKAYSNAGSLQARTKAAALRAWLGKLKIQLELPGRSFVPGAGIPWTKIGDKIDVTILSNRAIASDENVSADDITDKKRSGQYVVYACRHSMFTNPNKYTVAVDCFKLTNSRGSTLLSPEDFLMSLVF